MIKTYEGWSKSRQNLDEYLQIGDVVDEVIYEYFLNVMPPAYWSESLLQIGEPASHTAKGATFATLKRTARGWVYAGECYRGYETKAI